MTPTSFHGDPARKALYVDRLRRGIAEGRFFYSPPWQDGHGSALGLTIEAEDPAAYADALGYPPALVLALDMIVNFQPRKAATDFAIAWLERAPVGADLSALPAALVIEVLERAELCATTAGDARTDAARRDVLSLHRRAQAGEAIDRAAWRAARRQAVAAADAATGEVHRTAAAVAEAAAWPGDTRTILLDTLAAASIATTTRGLAAMGWTRDDEEAAFALLDRIMSEKTAPEHVDLETMCARMTERAPDLGRRFARRSACTEAGSQVYRDVGRSLLHRFETMGAAILQPVAG